MVIAFAGLLMKTLLLCRTLAIALSLLFTGRSKCNSLGASKVDPNGIFSITPYAFLGGTKKPYMLY
jgi:hypothetical protein